MKKRSRVKRLAKFVLRGGRRRVGAAGPLRHKPKLILFDFDGTLADTLSLGLEILNHLAEEFGYEKLPAAQLESARDLSTRQLMKQLGISRIKLPRIAKRGTAEMALRIGTVQSFHGIPALVRQLHTEGYRLGVLTSNSEENVTAFLAKERLEIFEFVKSSSKLLGKGSVLRRIMRATKLKPREILFIGDEIRDIDAAQETGVHIAAVTWGYNSRTALESATPDHILDSPEEITELLRSTAEH
jgi:HAD superfamily hydrolase (TIGR01549 family)